MTDKEIIEMAEQAGYIDLPLVIRSMELKELRVFAKLVAEKEREECAQTVLNIAGFKEYEFAANSIRTRGQNNG